MATPPRILVTGATGFIGSTLTQQLVSDGADVRIFRRDTSSLALLGDAADAVEHAVGDVRRPRSLRRAMEDIDRVYHAAALVSFTADAEILHRVNAEGTANVVNAALDAGVDRLLLTSSIAALGRPRNADAVIDETTEWRGRPHRSAYARSKHRAEREVHRGVAEGLDAVIVNPSLVFGAEKEGTTTHRIVDAVRRGWVRAVPPGGTNVVDVQDVASGHRKAMAQGETSRRYVLGGDNRSWQQIIAALARAFEVEPPRYTLPPSLLTAGGAVAEAVGGLTRTSPVFTRELARMAARTYRYSNTRARTELGCTFRSFDATARRIAGALRRQS